MSSREERNLQERGRRMRMKLLFSHLSSLVSPHSHLPIPHLIDKATLHITQMKERVEKLNDRKAKLMERTGNHCSGGASSRSFRSFPNLHIDSQGPIIQVNLISNLDTKSFKLYQIVSILQEEGVETTSVNLYNTGDRVIYTIIAQAMISRIGFETSRIEQRLRDLIF